jgi:NAD-dependent dihydropyrimidine dehydrogenase PreA subunit
MMMFNAYQTNTLEFNPALCNGCGICRQVCPHGVFALNGRRAVLVAPLACMECGACQLNCATGAITVQSGVGCAAAMIRAALTGQKEPTCG